MQCNLIWKQFLYSAIVTGVNQKQSDSTEPSWGEAEVDSSTLRPHLNERRLPEVLVLADSWFHVVEPAVEKARDVNEKEAMGANRKDLPVAFNDLDIQDGVGMTRH